MCLGILMRDVLSVTCGTATSDRDDLEIKLDDGQNEEYVRCDYMKFKEYISVKLNRS